ncbi:MAG TPA: hypothetical protein ENN44_04535 [Methanoculleus sp.]|nr:hypothetical protein [Methanoculleus sp.]
MIVIYTICHLVGMKPILNNFGFVEKIREVSDFSDTSETSGDGKRPSPVNTGVLVPGHDSTCRIQDEVDALTRPP